MTWVGVLFGLGAAASQSVSYIFSRLFVLRRRQGVVRLLVLSHVIMGLASAAMLPLFWRSSLPGLGSYVWPLLSAAGCYLLGQVGLFFVLRLADASRVSPLLAIKVVMLALLTVSFQGKALTGLQWGAVAASVVGAVTLSYSGGLLPWRAIVGIVLTCLAYSFSDMSIVALVRSIQPSGEVRTVTVMVAVCQSYIVCGLAAAAIWPFVGGGSAGDLRYAAPFAAAWLAAMICLYACFAYIGVVYGNIMQSMRGLISILIGTQLVRLGMRDLETPATRLVLARRLTAAVLMTAAVAMYQLGM